MATTFESLSAQKLLVPLSAHPAALESLDVFTHRRLGAGAALSSGAMDLSHLPLTPAAAQSQDVQTVLCSSGHPVPALSLMLDEPFRPEASAIDAEISVVDELAPLRRDLLPAWVEQLRHAGVHADRRSSPNLIAQLVQAVERPVDAVICCVVDSDPAAMLLRTLAVTFQRELIAGVAAISRLVGAARSALATGGALRWDLENRRLRAQLSIHELVMSGDYPLADPSLLLWACLGRKLRPGRLPTEVGVILLDAAAAVAVGRFVLARQPMLATPIAVHDWSAHQCRLGVAPIGISLRDVLGHFHIPAERMTLRLGDSLRDRKIGCDVIVAGGELVFHISPVEPPINPEPCIRCGWCVEVCPTQVQPAGVLEAAQRENPALAERMGIEACIECGLCSYVCPSNLPLLGAIREMKSRNHG